MLKFNISILFIVFNSIVFAKIDDNYIRKYNTILGIKFYATSNGLNYKLSDFYNTDVSKKYSAKFPLAFGVQVTVANFSLAHTFEESRRLINSDLNQLAISEFWGLDLNYVGNAVVIENNFGRYRNFKIENNCNCLADNASNFAASPEFYYDAAMQSIQYNGSIQYIFNNKKWSYAALFNQNNRQLKSAGSFILKLEYDYQQVKNENNLLINQTTNYTAFDKYNLLAKIKSSVPLLNIGYGYTLIYKRMFLGGIAYVGPGWIKNSLAVAAFTKSFESINFNGKLRLASGYNGKIFFAGLSTNLFSMNSNINRDFKLNWFNYEYNAYFGFRLAVRKLRK